MDPTPITVREMPVSPEDRGRVAALIHFRPGARSAYDETLAAQHPVSVEETFGDEGIGDESLGIIGGCTEPPRNVSPDDPTAQLCYLDPPGVCRLC
jgi:hypothetical protein